MKFSCEKKKYQQKQFRKWREELSVRCILYSSSEEKHFFIHKNSIVFKSSDLDLDATWIILKWLKYMFSMHTDVHVFKELFIQGPVSKWSKPCVHPTPPPPHPIPSPTWCTDILEECHTLISKIRAALNYKARN